MTVTKEQLGKGNGQLPDSAEPIATQTTRACDAPAREADSVTGGDAEDVSVLEGLLDQWVEEGKSTGRRLGDWFARDSALRREHPASLGELFRYWVQAPMAGGVPLLKWVQRIDGFTAGLFGTVTGYAWAWLWQRPLRRYTFIVLGVVVWRLH